MLKPISLLPYALAALMAKMGIEKILGNGKVFPNFYVRKKLKTLHGQAYNEKLLQIASDDGMISSSNVGRLQEIELAIAALETT